MIDILKEFDRELFLFLNGLHSSFFDELMYWISEKTVWIPLYLFLIFLIIRKYRIPGLIITLGAILSIVISDQTGVHLFKNVFERLRPCHEPDLAGVVHTVKGHCGGKFGFVSNHAINTFTLATYSSMFLGKKIRYYTPLIFFWCSLVAYSRIYLGVHYPGDVLGGAILGLIIGYLMSRFIQFANGMIFSNTR